jgi:hypothetical protein
MWYCSLGLRLYRYSEFISTYRYRCNENYCSEDSTGTGVLRCTYSYTDVKVSQYLAS